MKRVTGIGGIFFKSKNPETSRAWYNKHLGLNTDQHGTSFEWRQSERPDSKGFTVWSPFAEDTTYMQPSDKQFMINFRVENLVELLKVLKEEGVQQIGELQEFEYGKFAHIMDLEGNKLELWESFDDKYEEMTKGQTTY